MIVLEPIASADGLDIARYGRLLAKFELIHRHMMLRIELAAVDLA